MGGGVGLGLRIGVQVLGLSTKSIEAQFSPAPEAGMQGRVEGQGSLGLREMGGGEAEKERGNRRVWGGRLKERGR